MPGPMPEALFDALMARAGIAPTPAERASMLGASAHITAMVERVRPRGGVAVEPATIFVPTPSAGDRDA